jgi:hypothetical protein
MVGFGKGPYFLFIIAMRIFMLQNILLTCVLALKISSKSPLNCHYTHQLWIGF